MIILKKLLKCNNHIEREKIIYDYAWKLEQEDGWINSMIEGGVVSPDGSTIFYYARSPYNGELEQFNRDRESYEKNIKEMMDKGDFVTYNNR